jgi:hypothetical protein
MDQIPQNIRLLSLDVDGGYKSVKPTGEYLGISLMLKQIPFHLRRFNRGRNGYKRVQEVMVEYGDEGTAYAQKELFDIIGNTIDVSKENVYKETKKILNKKMLPYFDDFNNGLADKGIGVVASTTGYDVIGYCLLEKYPNFLGFSANPIVWEKAGKRIHGPEIVIRKPGENISDGIPDDAVVKSCLLSIRGTDDKERNNLEMTRMLKVDVKDMAVAGNDYLDHKSMKRAGLAISTPPADDATKRLVGELNGIVIPTYENAAVNLLRNYQPRRLPVQ